MDHIMIFVELTDDAPFDTLDLLRDPAIAAKHLELQYVSFVTTHNVC
jgi:hypothetical protein